MLRGRLEAALEHHRGAQVEVIVGIVGIQLLGLQEQVLDQVAEQAKEGKRCVVCAWGDLNFSARELVERGTACR